MVLCGIVLIIMSFFAFNKQSYHLNYHLVENNNKRTEIELIAKDEKYISIEQKGKEEVKVLPEELFSKYRIEPYIKKHKYIFTPVYVLCMGFVLIIIFTRELSSSYKKNRMGKKLRKIFSD